MYANCDAQFAEEKYKLDMESGSNHYQFTRAISSGVEGGIFVLPKGPSGKIKLAPKAKLSDGASKEVRVLIISEARGTYF